MTTLGLDERLERVLAYLFFWVSGLLLFLFEKNRNVRWHALQSMITFGSLSILTFAASMLRFMLHFIPFLNLLTDFALGVLINVLWWATLFLWGWLMVMAWTRPNYRLPFISDWIRHML
jgi:uncharacterized membrane protein